jgi:hypothetical protein
MRYEVFITVKVHTPIFSVMGIVNWWEVTTVLEEYTAFIFKVEMLLSRRLKLGNYFCFSRSDFHIVFRNYNIKFVNRSLEILLCTGN